MRAIDESEKLVARIIAKLKQNGVFHEEIYVSKFFPTMAIEEKVLFQEVVEWLQSKGIVRIRSQRMGGPFTELIFEAVLSSKGYSILAQPFSEGKTMNDAVEKVSSSGLSQSSAGEFIGGILGGFTKSVSS